MEDKRDYIKEGDYWVDRYNGRLHGYHPIKFWKDPEFWAFIIFIIGLLLLCAVLSLAICGLKTLIGG